MKIGELAQSTNLSVRTLHHYDDIDLLKPSYKSDAGHRVYSTDDVLKLQKILSLKSLGLSLGKIKESLNNSDISLIDNINKQMEIVEAEIELKKKLLNRLKIVSKNIQDDFDKTIEKILKTTRELAWIEKHLCANEIGLIQDKMNSNQEIKTFQDNWPEYIAKVKSEMKKGTSPDNPIVQELALMWLKQKELWEKEAPEEIEKVRRAQESDPNVNEMFGITSDIVEYVQAAVDSYRRAIRER